jgi:hypothetical protein
VRREEGSVVDAPDLTKANELTVGDDIPPNCEPIELHVPELRLLFEVIDYSPLGVKDLDPRVEDFIVSAARSAPRNAPLALQVHVDRPAPPDEAAAVGPAVDEFFRLRSLNARRRLRQLFRMGRTSLLIGLSVLALAVIIASVVDMALEGRRIGALIRESTVIGGWVAMWRPLEIFLYDWWPIRAERQLFLRLSAMPVRIMFKAS